MKFKAVKSEKLIINGEEKEKTSHYKPRGLRWFGLKAEENKKTLSKVIDVEKNNGFPLCFYMLHGVTPVFFYAESSREVQMVPRANLPHAIYFLLAIIAPTLLPLKLEGKESVSSYNPHRIRFSFNKGA